MKPATPFPSVTVVKRDGAPFLTDAGMNDEPSKKWVHLSMRIDDQTLRRLDVLKQTFPDKSKAQLVREAIRFYAKHYPR